MANFRRMLRSDVPLIVEMDRRNFSDPITEKILMAELNREVSYYVVLEENETILGYAGMWEILGEAHITNVCVDIPHRGKGFGNEIMAHLIKRCVKRHFFAMLLEVRVSNEAAIALYTKHKFYSIGVRKNYYSNNGEDALILWRELDSEDII